MKRICSALLTFLLACAMLLVPGLADAPELDGVFPSDDVLIAGSGESVEVSYHASTAGTLTVTLYGLESGEKTALHTLQVAAGAGVVRWDGTVQGTEATPGMWEIQLSLADASGQRSMLQAALVELRLPAPRPTLMPPELRPLRTPSPERQLSPHADPHAHCFWRMDIDNLDPTVPADQAVIWEILMQPITVLDTGPTEHIYPLVSPGADPKDVANITGQLHGTTQGVHVLETLDNGWSFIEAYSNDGYGAPKTSVRDFSGRLIQGYVPTDRLKVVVPNENIALVIDKLRQRLYVFQNGVMTGELLVSTGLATKSSPNTETTPGEFLTASWVGKFPSGNMQCDLAIRINGGVLLHEVPHKETAEGGRNYAAFEQYLGRKASHGCVRVQRTRNAEGMNMQWLWNNLKRNAKVLIWDDVGRSLPPPDPALPVYYNPDGGKNYHSVARCRAVRDRYLPLTEIFYGELNTPPYDALTPCGTCNPLPKYEGDEAYFSEPVPDDIWGDVDEASELEQEVDPETYGYEGE